MSALEFHPIRAKGKSSSGDLSVWCQHSTSHYGTARHAKKKATILDYPGGLLCDGCAKEWRKIWDDALDPRPEEDK